MAKPVKTWVKVKGTDRSYEARSENATYEQLVKHYLSVLADKVLIDELKTRGYRITKHTA